MLVSNFPSNRQLTVELAVLQQGAAAQKTAETRITHDILLWASLYCFPFLIVTQFLSIIYFTNSDSPFSCIISIPFLRFVRVIN
jgi:hypothetical protein